MVPVGGGIGGIPGIMGGCGAGGGQVGGCGGMLELVNDIAGAHDALKASAVVAAEGTGGRMGRIVAIELGKGKEMFGNGVGAEAANDAGTRWPVIAALYIAWLICGATGGAGGMLQTQAVSGGQPASRGTHLMTG